MSDLPSGWACRSVESICERVTSGGTPSRGNPGFYEGGTINWFKTGELKDRMLYESDEKITPEALQESSAKMFPVDTVLLALYGDGNTITSLGLLRRPAATNQACCAMIVNKDAADPRFLFYALKYTRADLLRVVVGGAQRNLSGKLVREHQIPIPELDEQRAIAGVLGSLDDKIQQNERTGRALEELARATFKAWFVDFEPVKAKAAGQTGFPGMPAAAFAALPDRFAESEGRRVPQGWHPSDFGSEFDFQVGFAFKSAEFTDAPNAVRLVRGDNVKEGWIEWGSKTRRWNDLNEKIDRYNLALGDVVIGMDGSKLGKNWARVRDFDLPSLLVQRVARFRSVGAAGPSLLWLLVSHPTFREFVEAVKTGTSIPHISGGQLKSFTFVKPGSNAPVVWSSFEHAVAPLLAMADQAAGESRKLAELRDYLLPRLLSGRVRLRDVYNGDEVAT